VGAVGTLDRVRGTGPKLWERSTGRADLSLIHHEQALEFATNLAQPQDQARAHDGLAHAHHALNDHDQARRHWRHAPDILTSLGIDQTEETQVSAPNIRAHLTNLNQQSPTATG
jgi:hypothetical protein